MFIQEGGERSILMAPAATSLINAQAVNDYFGKIHNYCIVTVCVGHVLTSTKFNTVCKIGAHCHYFSLR